MRSFHRTGPRGIKQIVVGDRFTDPNWFGINVNAQTFLPAPPDQIASLTLIDLQGATLTTRFTSTTHDYKANVKGSGPITIAVQTGILPGCNPSPSTAKPSNRALRSMFHSRVAKTWSQSE